MKVTESLHVCHKGHTLWSGWNRQGEKKSNDAIKAIAQVGIGIFSFPFLKIPMDTRKISPDYPNI